jgi:yjeF C-terminal region, hydroxyethylthiazole kinase-related/yjeF N-terminal region
MNVRVASASETVACERATMTKGRSSAALMRRAGEAAAAEILLRFPAETARGVAIYAGSGNNGGDGWIVAGALAASGIAASVVELGSPRSEEAIEARATALASGVVIGKPATVETLIVDALLGTGSHGAPRGEIADAIEQIERGRKHGAKVVSLDVPSGLDATTGKRDGALAADLTISFGTMKRGALISRECCGDIVLIDIGLDCDDVMSKLPRLLDAKWVSGRVPRIPVDAHKGTRGRLAIVGGGLGMAGAVILSGQAALRSGIGLLRIVASPANETAVHAAVPQALFSPWPSSADDLSTLTASSDVIAIGPGLGNSRETRDLVERILLAWTGPVVIDADGLNVFAGDLPSLAKLLKGRPAVITPHPAEMGRLIGKSVGEILDSRFEIGSEVASALDAAVLLKGTPTVVFSPRGERYVSASGTAALATGGSGDLLTGIVATLLIQARAQGDGPTVAGACAAFIHGRAAELCRSVRGTTLDDVLAAMPAAWNEKTPAFRDGLLAELFIYR